MKNDIEMNLLDKNNINEDKINYNEKKMRLLYMNENCINKLFFHWSFKTFYEKFSKKKYILNYSKHSSQLFINNFNNYDGKKSFLITPSNLFLVIFKTNLSTIIVILFLSFSTIIFQLLQYVFLRTLMDSFSNNINTNNIFIRKIKNATLFLISRILYTFSNRHRIFLENILSSVISNQIISIIQNKTSNIYLNKDNTLIGKIINYILFDCEDIAFLFNYGPASVVVPFQIIICIYFIYKYCMSDIIVIYIMLILLLIAFTGGYIVEKLYFKTHAEYLNSKDERVKELNETLKMIKEIKMNHFEDYFYNKILDKRKKEVSLLKRINNQGIVNNYLFFSIHIFYSIFIFGYMIYFKNPNFAFETPEILTIIFILNILTYPLYRFPVFITGIIEAYVSTKRICSFLNDYSGINMYKNELEFTLDLSKVNQSICIFGNIGSGKSTLIKNILMDKRLNLHKISYCSQENFIMNTTIRNNILFGNEFDIDKYEKIINLCKLNTDIKTFHEGDKKICGINGCLISGGQKARIELARAIYNETDIYLIDDVFFGLDQNIAKNIFNDVIINYLNKKICVFVISNINGIGEENLKKIENFIILDKGKIIFNGTYDELIKNDFYIKFKSLSHNNENNSRKKNNDKIEILSEESSKSNIKIEKNKKDTYNRATVRHFIKYIGIIVFILLILFPIIYEMCELYRTLFISNTRYYKEINDKINFAKRRILYFCLYSFYSAIFLLLKIFLLYYATYILNITLHNLMLKNVLAAPLLSFHYKISDSEKINHLNKDLEKLKYPLKFFSNSVNFFISFCLTVLICTFYSKISLISVPLILGTSIILLKIYLKKSIEFNHIERESKSPIISHISETLSSAIYLKSFKKKEYFIDLLYQKEDYSLITIFLKFGASAWYNLNIDLIGIFYLSILLFYCIFKRDDMNKNNIEIGILISYSNNLISNILNFLENIVNFFNEKVPFNRCDEYCELQLENNIMIKNNKIGLKHNYKISNIKFEKFSMKYNINSDNILKNISFEINKNSKIAIIGRTGSGKSSLILCLLRIIQDENYTSGNIYLNGINIKDFDLYDLRDSMSVISQTPFVFDGTFRDNIDPNHYYKNDNLLLNKLKEIPFYEQIKNKFGNLQNKIIQRNYSLGEKQLLCLIRVLISNKDVLILDEATSNINLQTEKIIYETIDKLCNNMIIISIIHKLEYIEKYDRILLVDNGIIIEINNHNDVDLYSIINNKKTNN